MSRGFLAFGVIAAVFGAACGADDSTSGGSLASREGSPTLRPGEVAELTVAGDTAGVTLVTGGPHDRYVVVIASTKYDTSGAASAWSVDPTAAPAGAPAPRLAEGCALDSSAWSTVTVPAETAPAGTAAAVGTRKTLHAETPDGNEDIEVEAIAVGDRAVVWADVTATHPAVLDPAFVSQFLADFEKTILPRERGLFGVESDIDGDGHIGLVFTPLTHRTSVAFFTSCDLVQSNGCTAGNRGEYLWLTPPNAIDPPYNTPNAIKEILAHELSHLIHFDRKVLRNHLGAWTDSGYMDEGVGGFAQDAIGPQAGNLYVTMAALDGIADYSLGDTLVDGTQYDDARDGVLRGGSYLFVRWLYDRAGGDVAKADGTLEGHGGPALVRALLDAPESVAHALPRLVGRSLEELGTDFYTTLAMSNRDQPSASGAAPANSCFGYLPTQVDPITGKQRGTNLFGNIHGMPMTGVAMTDESAGTVRAGGAAYVTVTANGATLPLTVHVAPGAAARVRVGRLE